MHTAIRTLVLLASVSLLLQVKSQPLATSTSSISLTSTATSTTRSTSSVEDPAEAAYESAFSSHFKELQSYIETASTIPFSSPTPGLYFTMSGGGCPRGIKIGEVCCYGDVIDGKCFANRPEDAYIDFADKPETFGVHAGSEWYDSNIRLVDADTDFLKIDSAQSTRESLTLVGMMGALAIIGVWF